MLKLFYMRLRLLILRNYFLNIISFKIYDVNTVLLLDKKEEGRLSRRAFPLQLHRLYLCRSAIRQA